MTPGQINLQSLTEHLRQMTITTGQLNEAPTRDWANFFQALIKFLAAVLPMILPLFTDQKPSNS